MKILYIDKASLQTMIRIQTLEENEGMEIVHAKSFSDVNLYSKDTYDVVLIDHVLEDATTWINYINSIDPMQQVLSVSGAGFCLYASCDDCIANHSARRLNNPTTIRNITRMLRGFATYNCDHYDTYSKK